MLVHLPLTCDRICDPIYQARRPHMMTPIMIAARYLQTHNLKVSRRVPFPSINLQARIPGYRWVHNMPRSISETLTTSMEPCGLAVQVLPQANLRTIGRIPLRRSQDTTRTRTRQTAEVSTPTVLTLLPPITLQCDGTHMVPTASRQHLPAIFHIQFLHPILTRTSPTTRHWIVVTQNHPTTERPFHCLSPRTLLSPNLE